MSILSPAKIEKLWEAYRKDQTPHGMAKLAGVHWKTAKRYIETGDPKHGIESFKKRLSRLQEKMDFDRAKEQIADVKAIKGLFARAYQDLFETDKSGKIKKLKNDPTIMDLDRLLRLKYFLAGEPDSRVEHLMKGQIVIVVEGLIGAVAKFVKDQKTRNLIADELQRVIDRVASSGRLEGSAHAN